MSRSKNKGNERYHVVVALVDARYINGPMIYQFCDFSTNSKSSALRDLNRVVRKANPFLKGKRLFPKEYELPLKARGKTLKQWLKDGMK